MRLAQTAIKEQEARAAQLLKEAQAERAAAGRVHAAAKERASADLRQQLDALASAQQQEITRLEVRLLLLGPLVSRKMRPTQQELLQLDADICMQQLSLRTALYITAGYLFLSLSAHSMLCDISASATA